MAGDTVCMLCAQDKVLAQVEKEGKNKPAPKPKAEKSAKGAAKEEEEEEAEEEDPVEKELRRYGIITANDWAKDVPYVSYWESSHVLIASTMHVWYPSDLLMLVRCMCGQVLHPGC